MNIHAQLMRQIEITILNTLETEAHSEAMQAIKDLIMEFNLSLESHDINASDGQVFIDLAKLLATSHNNYNISLPDE